MTDPDPHDPADPLDFEQSLGELERIAGDLESGDLGLEAALSRYERGVRLLKQCHEVLERAERRIELLSGLDADGKPIRQEVADVSTLHAQSVRLDPAPAAAEKPAPAGPRKALALDEPLVGDGRASGDGATSDVPPNGSASAPASVAAGDVASDRPVRKPAKKKRVEPGDDSPRAKARALFAESDDPANGRDSGPDDFTPGDPSEAPF